MGSPTSRLSSLLFAVAATIAATESPAAQTELTGVAQLDARAGHACVVTTGGGVKCWGSNSSGQLGGGPLGSFRPNATDVVGLASGAVAVATSTSAHTCAVLAGGGVKCWGANQGGQLGDGTTTTRPEPVDVVGLPWPAVAVAAGDGHTCALSNAGAVACWGANSVGQLGDGTTTQRLAPTPVSGLSSGAVAISASTSHTCAITAAGGVKCWGRNVSGQLGDGTTTDRTTPVDVIGISGAASLTTSGQPGAPGPQFFADSGRSCAIAAGVTKCWSASGPVDVEGVTPGSSSLTRGGGHIHILMASKLVLDHACVVTPAGAAQCWGMSYCGMIGDGTVPSCSNMFLYPYVPPTVVAGLSSGVTSVSAASTFTCALLSANGQVKCWGAGYGGSPVAAMQGTNPQQIVFPTASAWPSISVNGSGDIPVSAMTIGGSGNPVVFTSLTPSTCSVSGTVITGLAGGTCTIAANQAGSEYYDPAVEQTFSIPVEARLAQAITFGPAPTIYSGGAGSVHATASSGLPVTLSVASQSASICSVVGNAVIVRTLGTCTVLANQAGDATWSPAPQASLSIQVNQNLLSLPLLVFKSGGGTGTVTSPIGIDCGLACAGNFMTFTSTTLTATADPGSTFVGWSGGCSGTAPCVLYGDAAKFVGAHFGSEIPRPTNLSTRGTIVVGGNDSMIAGFVIGGSANKRVVVRARGPSLAESGISPVVGDTVLTLVQSSDQRTIGFSDSWLSAPNAPELSAIGLAPTSPLEGAILTTLAPGAYTAIAVAPGVGTGTAIVEVFEVGEAVAPLVNVSTRGRVGLGNDVLIGGLIIDGSGPQTVVVRARGPSLAPFGVTDVLANPHLQLVRSSDQQVIATNDNWGDAANASAITASGFAPSEALEAAILVTLPPGAYTAIVSGAGGTTGNGIVEVFRVN